MKNIKDIYGKTYQNYSKLPEMRKLWHSGYWDGPLSGMCLIDGTKYWFSCIEEWDDNNTAPPDDEDFEAPWYRRFLIWKLTEGQQLSIDARHSKFQRMVGTHCDYDEHGHRGSFSLTNGVTEESFKKYYEESKYGAREDICPEESQILGWYEW